MSKESIESNGSIKSYDRKCDCVTAETVARHRNANNSIENQRNSTINISNEPQFYEEFVGEKIGKIG
jgi:hypothetical protein